MKTNFPHQYFIAAALVFAAGAMAMTAAVISRDQAAILRLLDAYMYAYGAGMAALLGYAAYKYKRD